jgi:DNA-binding transcriptional ArsR family regulator
MHMDRVTQALVDPIRREILRMVRRRPLPAGAVADAFSVSRPAISRHLRVLREAGLVRDEAIGRERVYRLDPGPLAELGAFLIELGAHGDEREAWTRRLMALETEVYRTRAASKRELVGADTDRKRKKAA